MYSSVTRIEAKLFYVLTLCSFLVIYVHGAESTYPYTFKSKKCMVKYGFINLNDSAFIHGFVFEKSKKEVAVHNINIMIPEYRIGTVTQPDGGFRLYLPTRKGNVSFAKTNYDSFKIGFNLDE